MPLFMYSTLFVYMDKHEIFNKFQQDLQVTSRPNWAIFVVRLKKEGGRRPRGCGSQHAAASDQPRRGCCHAVRWQLRETRHIMEES
jgi:hypothetical protein